MERLTEKITNKETGEILAYRLKSACALDRIRADRKLGELEDAEEQGRLFVLPCKVGDYAWDLISRYRFEVVSIELHLSGLIMFRCGNKGTEDYAAFALEDIGDTWSLTEPKESDYWIGKTEAEAALERMKGERNE